MQMHNMLEGSLLKRLRIRFFGLTLSERAENQRMFSRILEAVLREQAIEDAEDELRFVQEWGEQSIADLRAEMAALPDDAARYRRLVDYFGEDACRIAPLFTDR